MQDGVTIQVNELENFLKISDHLKVILNRCNDLNHIDRNDIYDLIYCKKKLEEFRTHKISNDDIKNNIEYLLNNIDTILNSLSDKDYNEIINRKLKKNTDLNKIKYGKKSQFKDLSDNTRKDTVENNKVKSYLSKVITKISLIFIISIFIMNPSMVNSLVSKIINAMSTSIVIEAHSEHSESLDSDILSNEYDKGSEEVMQSTQTRLSIYTFILKMIMMLVLMLLAIQIFIDLSYISLPFIRSAYGENTTNFISDDALDIVKSPEYIEVAKRINSNDRIDVAEALLNNGIQYLNNAKNTIQTYGIDIHSNYNMIKDVENILNELQSIKSRINTKNYLEKIKVSVEAELACEKYNLNTLVTQDEHK